MANRYINSAVTLPNTSLTDVYTVPSGCSALVQSVIAANESGSSATITLTFYDSSATTSFTLIKDAAIPAASSGNLLDRPFPLEAGDKIRVQAGTGSAFDVTASILLVDDTTSVPVGTITTAAIADGAITLGKLDPSINLTPADGSITTAKLDADDVALFIKLANEVYG